VAPGRRNRKRRRRLAGRRQDNAAPTRQAPSLIAAIRQKQSTGQAAAACSAAAPRPCTAKAQRQAEAFPRKTCPVVNVSGKACGSRIWLPSGPPSPRRMKTQGGGKDSVMILVANAVGRYQSEMHSLNGLRAHGWLGFQRPRSMSRSLHLQALVSCRRSLAGLGPCCSRSNSGKGPDNPNPAVRVPKLAKAGCSSARARRAGDLSVAATAGGLAGTTPPRWPPQRTTRRWPFQGPAADIVVCACAWPRERSNA